MNINIEDFDSEETRRVLERALKIQKKSNPYPHIKDEEVSEIRKFFKRRKIRAENFLIEVEKNRANPYIATVTCSDRMSMNFAKIVAGFDVVLNRTKHQILILSNGKVVGGRGFDSSSALPEFIAGIIWKAYHSSCYIEINLLKVGCHMDEVAESSPISPWVFDALTQYISAPSSHTLTLKEFISSNIADRLRARCEKLSQIDFLVSSILKGDSDVFNLPLRSLLAAEPSFYGGNEITRIIGNYITNMNLLHMPPPEEWNISLEDVLVSQLVGDALEEK